VSLCTPEWCPRIGGRSIRCQRAPCRMAGCAGSGRLGRKLKRVQGPHRAWTSQARLRDEACTARETAAQSRSTDAAKPLPCWQALMRGDVKRGGFMGVEKAYRGQYSPCDGFVNAACPMFPYGIKSTGASS